MKKLLIIFTFVLCSISVMAQSDANRALITVTGQSEIMVVPDEAVFTMSAVTLDKDLAVAQAKNDETVRNVLALARKYQVPANLMQTGRISLEERYSDEEATRKPRVFLGYVVTKQIAIILRDVSKAEGLLGDIFKSGITRISNVEFRTTQIRKHKDQARAMAIKAAQEKAIALTREIGQTIGKAYSITEEDNSGRMSMNSNSFMTAGERSEASEGTIALGQISITARVTVSFELK